MWVEVQRKSRCQGREYGRKKFHGEKIFQMFVKVPGSAETMLDVTPSAKPEVNKKLKCETGDAYLTFEGKVLRGRDELKGCGISDGSTV